MRQYSILFGHWSFTFNVTNITTATIAITTTTTTLHLTTGQFQFVQETKLTYV